MTINAKIVLLCIGGNTNSLKQIFPDYQMNGEQYLALRQYFENAYYEDQEDYASEIYFYKEGSRHAIYTTRLPNNRAMIEIMTTKEYFNSHDLDLETSLLESIKITERLNRRFRNAVASGKAQGTSLLMGPIPRKLSDTRFLVAGSALGHVHIFTGAGVGHAMRSGQLAAHFASKSLKENDFSATFFEQYDKEIARRFGSDIFVNRLLCSVDIHSPLLYSASKLFVAVHWLVIKIQYLIASLTSEHSGNREK